MDQPFKVSSLHVDTGSCGAVFRIRVETDGFATPEATHERHRAAVGVLDEFCESYYAGRTIKGDVVVDSQGADILDEWPFDDDAMVYKYSGFGDDWGEMAIIISDRHLAAIFKKAFCQS